MTMRAFKFAVRWLTPPWLDRIIARHLARKHAALTKERAGLQSALDALSKDKKDV